MNYTIKNDYYTLTVSEPGAELISIKANNGSELLWQSPENKFWKKHAPLLFPVCGRLKDSRYKYGGVTYEMSGHGFIGNINFTLCEKSDTKIVLKAPSTPETKKIYPFDYDFIAKYALEGKKILFSVTVENKDEKVMPFMFGWHPGFALPTKQNCDIEDYSLDFSGIDKLSWTPLQNEVFASPEAKDYPLEEGKYKLCEDEIYKNDTMIFSSHNYEVILSAKNSTYSLKMSWSDNLPYLCIWKDPDNEAKYICLEPWSDIPNNGFDEENFETRKMTRLEPGKKNEYSYTLEFTI